MALLWSAALPLAWSGRGARRHMSLVHVRKEKGRLPAGPFLTVKLLPALYQTRQALARTIFCPDLQLKACWNSDMFETTLLIRKTGRECGSVVTTTLRNLWTDAGAPRVGVREEEALAISPAIGTLVVHASCLAASTKLQARCR